MQVEKCDILIIGAGPAGASAARAAAQAGLGVIVAERRATVGIPVQCAEYIPAPLLGQAKLSRDVVVQKIDGMRTVVPGCEVKPPPLRDLSWPGTVLTRPWLLRHRTPGLICACLPGRSFLIAAMVRYF